MPDTIDLAAIVLFILVGFAAAAVSGVSGSGVGLIITLFITPIIGAPTVVAATLVHV